MRFLEKISGFLYPIVLIGMIGGFAWQFISVPQLNLALNPSALDLLSGGAAMLITSYLAERLMPLRALSELRWVYKLRPKNQMRTFDWISVAQLVVFFLVFNVVHPGLGIAAVITRLVAGLVRRRSLANLLQAGRTRGFGMVQDSSLVSEVLAAQWIRHWKQLPGPVVLRRYLRRSYLILAAVALFLYASATNYLLGKYVVILFAVCWTVLGAEAYRCADLGKLRRNKRAEIAVLAIHSVVGAAICLVFIPMVWWKLALLAAALAWGSYRRGRPRRITTLTYSDHGIGVSVPPELVSYFFSGLIAPVVVAVLIA